MIPLPTQTRSEPLRRNPRTLVIYGKPKSGKTKLASLIPGALILDLDNGGTDHLSNVMALRIIGLQPPKETPETKEARHKSGEFYLIEVVAAIKETIAKTGYPYKKVVLDTATALEDWLDSYATAKYMNSVQGKGFNREKDGTVMPKNKWESVVTLPMGAGYKWLRDAFDEWMGMIHDLAPDIVVICHLKDKLITKAGKELSSTDLALTGKIAQTLAASSDAIGYIFRKKNKTYINFASGDDTCGARCDHLRGKEVLLMEEDESGAVIANHWDEVYID